MEPQNWSIKSFYQKYFPTDRETFCRRIPFLGFICTISCSVTFFARIHYFSLFFPLLSFGVAFQLYCGLKNEDRKQLTPWIILKFIEIQLVTGCYLSTYFCQVNLAQGLPLFVMFIINTAINVWTFYVVVARYLKMSNLKVVIVSTDAPSNSGTKQNPFGPSSVPSQAGGSNEIVC